MTPEQAYALIKDLHHRVDTALRMCRVDARTTRSPHATRAADALSTAEGVLIDAVHDLEADGGGR